MSSTFYSKGPRLGYKHLTYFFPTKDNVNRKDGSQRSRYFTLLLAWREHPDDTFNLSNIKRFENFST